MWIDAHNHLQDALLAETLPILTSLPMEAAVVNGTTEADWPRCGNWPLNSRGFDLHSDCTRGF